MALIRSGEDWGYHGVELPAVGASSPLACSAWELPSSSSFSNNLLHHQLLLLLLLLHHLLLLLLLAAHGICCLLPCSTFSAPHWLPVVQNLQKEIPLEMEGAPRYNCFEHWWHCLHCLWWILMSRRFRICVPKVGRGCFSYRRPKLTLVIKKSKKNCGVTKKYISHNFRNWACPRKLLLPIAYGKKCFKFASSISKFVGDMFLCDVSHGFSNGSHFVVLDWRRATKIGSKMPRSQFLPRRHLFSYVYRAFHLLWPITISLFVSE